MEPLLTSAEMQKADRFTISLVGIPELVLMEHASLAVFQALQSRFESHLKKSRGLVLAGPGNNGGDALAVARLLHQAGHSNFSVLTLGKEDSRSSSCQIQFNVLQQLGVKMETSFASKLPGYDWIVDGIFGTGLNKTVEGKFREVIERVSLLENTWVVAIDIPSGLCADTGNPLGAAVKASETITLGFYKKGLVTGQASDYVGNLSLATIQIPRTIEGMVPETFLFDTLDAQANLPKRIPSGNKGSYGHIYIWAGRPETEGAAAITALGALRAGSGLVSLFGNPETLNQVRPRLVAEIMSSPYSKELLKKAGAFAIGPGMGTDDSAWEVLKEALVESKYLVVDADGLNQLAQREGEALALCQQRANPILITPHPKEAARLLKTSVEEIQRDRYASVKKLATTWNAWVLLKGRGTLIAGPSGSTWAVNRGSPVLSKGGTGDLLTGIVVSLLAQGLEPQAALALGAYLHGRAAEIITQKRGENRTALASEISNELSAVFSELESVCRPQ